jgi:hypothetical protein
MDKNDEKTELLKQIASSLEVLVKRTQITSYPLVKQTLETVLDTEQKRQVYDLLDGEKTVAEIQKLSGANPRHISEWGQEWERIGIVEESGRKGRRQKSFDLTAFGIVVAEISNNNNNLA